MQGRRWSFINLAFLRLSLHLCLSLSPSFTLNVSVQSSMSKSEVPLPKHDPLFLGGPKEDRTATTTGSPLVNCNFLTQTIVQDVHSLSQSDYPRKKWNRRNSTPHPHPAALAPSSTCPAWVPLLTATILGDQPSLGNGEAFACPTPYLFLARNTPKGS